MIVRERRKEIGVLKAIGSSNIKIVTQFISESVSLTFLGTLVGLVAGALLASPIMNVLVSSSLTSGQQPERIMGGGIGGRMGMVIMNGQSTIRNLNAVVSYNIILYGLAAALVIAIIGSAIPAWLISKVRPSEVLRGE